jgi:hypothetical protein
MAKVNKMEKTLREEIVELCEAIKTQRCVGRKTTDICPVMPCYECKADQIRSLIYKRIKAKALTDEQIKDATDFDALCCDGCYKITEKMTTAEADVYCLNCTLKAVAAAQLQAVLGELE